MATEKFSLERVWVQVATGACTLSADGHVAIAFAASLPDIADPASVELDPPDPIYGAPADAIYEYAGSANVYARARGATAALTVDGATVSTPGTAPGVSAEPTLLPATGSVGDTFTVSSGSYTGSPTVTFKLYENGTDVTGDMVGNDYTATEPGTLALVVGVSNGVAPRVERQVEAIVSAALVAPATITGVSVSPSSAEVGATFTISTGTAGGGGTVVKTTELNGRIVPNSITSFTPTRPGPVTVKATSANERNTASLYAYGVATAAATPPTGGDLGEILASGWQLQPETPATEDPSDPNGGSPETFTVQRPGFDTSGNAATRTLTVTKMKRIRDVYPATTPGADPAIALSRDIYVGDTVVGGTNSSTEASPATVAMWLTLDRTLHSTGGADLVVEASIWHASMCDGPGLATVRITDGTTTITATATTTETGTAYHNGLNPPRHRFTFSDAALATLDEGECTMHLNYKPYWGPEWDSETDGQTYGVVGAGYTGMAPRKIILDHGTLGVAYAVVDVVNGTAGAGDFTSTTIKEARADAAALDGTANTYTGIAAAAAALQAYANANFGRNDAGCCFILLSANGSVLQEDFNSVVTSLGALNIEPVVFGTPVNYTTAITTSRTLPLHTIWRNVNWVIAAATHIPWNGPAGGAFRSYQWEGGSLSASGAINVNAINIMGNWTAKNIDASGLGNISTGSQATVATVIGCTDVQTGYGHRFFGNVTPNIQVNNALSDRPQPVGQIVAFNQLTSDTGEGITMAAGSGAAGMVVAGNVPEYVGSVPAAGAVVSLVVGAEEVQNAIVVGNSVPLEKANIFYSDGAGDSNEKRPTLYAGNIWYSPNHKGDHFATDGTSIGNWPMRFRVNCRKNIHTTGDDQNDGVGPTEWQGELVGLGEVFGTDGTPIAVPWTDNQTTGNGLGAGGGDYSLTGDTSAVPKWAIGERPYTHDLFGTAIANDGTAPIGAVQ